MTDAEWYESVKAGEDAGWKLVWERVIAPEASSMRSAEMMKRYSLTDGDLMGLLYEEMIGRGSNAQESEKTYGIGAEQGQKLSAATDKVKDRFGEMAVFFGRELHVKEKTTGTGAKNPEDYLK